MKKIAKNPTSKLLQEEFIPDHVFLYIVRGAITFYDDSQNFSLRAGDCGLARKNRLLKYVFQERTENFFPIIFCFDEPFLKGFQDKYHPKMVENTIPETLIPIKANAMLDSFIHALKPYYKDVMKLDDDFEDLKYEEMLLILLKIKPDLAGIFFDYGMPEKINLEAFMNQNYKFNVSLDRFAFLTGRSLSTFKRDFKTIYRENPGHWLTNRRLQEAHFLLSNNKQAPSEVYLEVGFEDLSHFSHAFKKKYGFSPGKL